MAWTDIADELISTAGDSFNTYTASQGPSPFPYGYGSPYGGSVPFVPSQQQSGSSMLLLLLVIAGVFFFAFSRSK